MHQETVAVYERQADEYDRLRAPIHRDRAVALAERAAPGAVRIDLGCGPGRYTGDLGAPVVALDAAAAMLERTASAAPSAMRVRADLEALPFRRRSIGAAWSRMAYQHLPPERVPLALAHLHWSLDVDAPLTLQIEHGEDTTRTSGGDDPFPERLFAEWSAQRLEDVLCGAGFDVSDIEVTGRTVWASVRRSLSLPDTVGPGMRLLACGLNPAVYAAERGVGFCRPGNRFWPALAAAGLASRPNDPLHLLRTHGIGMTDMVKRATVRSAQLSRDEYRSGFERLERLVRWLRPGAVAFVGLEGWRAAVDPKASAGWQPAGVGGASAYVLPSTSGLNAHTRLADLVAHLQAAASAPPGLH